MRRGKRKAARERERERERKGPGGKKCVWKPRGNTTSPQRTNRLLGPCDPKQILATKRNHTGGGLSPSAREAHCTWWGLPGRRRDHLLSRPLRHRVPRRASRNVQSRKTGKTTDHKKKRANASTASRPRKRPQRSPERIQKTHGAQNGTPRKPQNKKDARPEQANKPTRRGQKKKQKGTLWGALFALDKLESPSNLMEAEIRLFECSPECEKLSSWNVVSGRQRKFNLLTY